MNRRQLVAVAVALLLVAMPVSAAWTFLATGTGTSSATQFSAGSLDDWTTSGSGFDTTLDYEQTTLAQESFDFGDMTPTTTTNAKRAGVVIRSSTPVASVSATLDADSQAQQALLVDRSTGDVIASANIGADDTVTFDGLRLAANSEYALVADDYGASYQQVDASGSFPVSDDRVTIVEGVRGATGFADRVLNWREVDVVPAEPGPARYVSRAYDQRHAAVHRTNIQSLSDADVRVTIQGYSGGSWSNITTATYSTDGFADTDISKPASETAAQYRTIIEGVPTGPRPKISILQEFYRYRVAEPSAELTSPSGGELITSREVTLSADVTDPAFGQPEGDTVTAEFVVGGETVAVRNVTSNGTVTADVQPSVGGNLEWYVRVTDYHGDSSTSGTETFETPSQLTIVDETNTSKIVTGANATVRFFSDGQVYVRDAPDGVVDFSGLPVDETFVVLVDADGYHSRRVVIPSLLEQQTAYLLPKNNTTSVNNAFVLDDKTGRYGPRDTFLFIQKPIEDADGNATYKTIVGSSFGAVNEFPAILEKDGRYRLIVENQAGDRRVLGSYLATADGVRTLTVGTITIDTPLNSTGYTIDVEREVNETNAQITVRWVDTIDATSQLDLTLYETRNATNVVDSYTSSSPGNESVLLTAGAEPRDLTLLVEAQRTVDGETVDVRARYPIRGANGDIDFPVPRWSGIAGLVAITFVAALTSRRFLAPMMVVTVGFAGMLMFFQLVEIWVPGWWIAAAIAVFTVLQDQGGIR